MNPRELRNQKKMTQEINNAFGEIIQLHKFGNDDRLKFAIRNLIKLKNKIIDTPNNISLIKEFNRQLSIISSMAILQDLKYLEIRESSAKFNQAASSSVVNQGMFVHLPQTSANRDPNEDSLKARATACKEILDKSLKDALAIDQKISKIKRGGPISQFPYFIGLCADYCEQFALSGCDKKTMDEIQKQIKKLYDEIAPSVRSTEPHLLELMMLSVDEFSKLATAKLEEYPIQDNLNTLLDYILVRLNAEYDLYHADRNLEMKFSAARSPGYYDYLVLPFNTIENLARSIRDLKDLLQEKNPALSEATASIQKSYDEFAKKYGKFGYPNGASKGVEIGSLIQSILLAIPLSSSDRMSQENKLKAQQNDGSVITDEIQSPLKKP